MPASSPSEAAPGPAQTIFDFWSLALHPAVARCVVERNSTFLHHFFQFAIADTVFAIPAHCPEDDFSSKCRPLNSCLICPSPQKASLSVTLSWSHFCYPFFATGPGIGCPQGFIILNQSITYEATFLKYPLPYPAFIRMNSHLLVPGGTLSPTTGGRVPPTGCLLLDDRCHGLPILFLGNPLG